MNKKIDTSSSPKLHSRKVGLAGTGDPSLEPSGDGRSGARSTRADDDGGWQPPTNLPEGTPYTWQYPSLEANTYHPYKVGFDKDGNPVTERNTAQTASMTIQPTVEVYYQANSIPPMKFVRVTIAGAGVGPGQLTDDGWWARGSFQDQIGLTMTTKDERFTIFELSPRTVNAAATLNYSASTTIGASASAKSDGSGSVSLNGSVSVTSSVATTLYDWQAVDYSGSTAQTARWEWSMATMGAGDPKYTYPYNGDPEDLLSWKGYIYPVPASSTSTVLPASQAVWLVDADISGKVEFSLTIDQRTVYMIEQGNLDRWDYWVTNTAAKTWTFEVDMDVPLDSD